jgi:hypothetical protein
MVGGQVGMVERRLHRLLVGMEGGRRRGVIEGMKSYKIGIVDVDVVMYTLIL